MGVGTDIEISGEHYGTILKLLQRHLPGVEAWAYGSRVHRASRSSSDLDLVVFAAPEQTRSVGDLREAFEESNLPFRIDLFVWSNLPESFRKPITANHVLIQEEGKIATDPRSNANSISSRSP